MKNCKLINAIANSKEQNAVNFGENNKRQNKSRFCMFVETAKEEENDHINLKKRK